ncbi:MAG: hypothetical protein ACJ74L_03995 [Gaiellaceae bacterium]
MDGNEFTLALTLGATLLAIWLDVRLAGVRPKSPMASLVNAGLSLIGLMSASGLLYLVDGMPQVAILATVLAVFLPALVYALLAGLWMLRALSGLSGLQGR